MTGPSDLTREALERLMELLAKGTEDPAASYLRLRQRLIKVVEIRARESRLRSAPDDLADEAIVRVAGQLERGLEIRAQDPFKYFYGVARRVVQEAVRQELKNGVSLENEEVVASLPGGEDDDKEERHRCLDECLGLLPGADRDLILDFYRGDRGQRRIIHRKRLARRLGMTLNALRIKAHRLRHKKLAPCIDSCVGRDETE